jgi:Hypervirulence associated proteins TUDOR domain
MTKPYSIGLRVCWKWQYAKPNGIIEEVFFEPASREIKGTTVKRNGSPDKPAYLIKQDNGNYVLKLHSEISEYI